MSITPEQFIRAWQASASLAEVAAKLEISERKASQRAHLYRKSHGIPLKSFSGQRKLDWSALAKLAEELL